MPLCNSIKYKGLYYSIIAYFKRKISYPYYTKVSDIALNTGV